MTKLYEIADDIEKVLTYVAEACGHGCGEIHDSEAFEAGKRVEAWLATVRGEEV